MPAATLDEKVKTQRKPIPDNTTQRYLPFSEVRDNLVIMKDGSSRMVLSVKPINFNLKSEQEQDAIIYSFQRFLNALSFPVQILTRSLKVDIEGYLARLKTTAIKQSNPLLQEQTYKYMDFLTNLVEMAQIMKKEFYVIVPHDESAGGSVRDVSILGSLKNFWSGTQKQKVDASNIRENRRRLESLKKGNGEKCGIVKGSLEQIGIKASVMEKDALIKLLISYYNPKMQGDNKFSDSARMDLQ